jgi:hypothetical protein
MPLDRLEAVIHAVFRPAVRRPALLGLLRELSRLPPGAAEHLTEILNPLVTRAGTWLRTEMQAGRLRQGDPSLIIALVYATVAGIATEPEALRVVGWSQDVIGLRKLRNELTSFLRAALAP